ncbi:transcriptional regulator, TetR family [Rhizobium sp. RU35A]|uniref:TetR/AcrR family transcriptional regulator n=1 Tax=Rhizobium straminoryzae TaxID=1387186 RepID=A0A549TCE8_9HYPH|nr:MULTISPECIES: TetR/AcrR family transcriptional regulator [Rhizobium]TRL39578.1 TetR/AcrR family transcriptional regulator [Rhizobium straminoryzae]SIR40752.1 transcriptional regulator, TetR family [Rhizobium sp. RU35A]
MPRPALTEEEIRSFRRTILAAAAKIVGREGLARLSMRGLADSLGMTAAALYRYYPSKQDLIIDFCRDAITDLRNRFGEIHRTTEDPLSAIRSMMTAYARFGLEDRDRFRMLFLENDQGLTSPLMEDEETMLPYRQLVEQVAKAAAAGLIVTADSERSTQTIWASVHGIVTLASTFNDFDFGNVDQLVDETIELLIRGLRSQGAAQ